MNKPKVLFNAHPKTSQHWLLFLVLNYHRILNSGATETIPYDDLAKFTRFKRGAPLKNVNMESIAERGIQDSDFVEGYPKLLRDEVKWDEKPWIQKLHESFDKVIYLYRNPYDTMISLFHWLKADSLWEIVRAHLDLYVAHVKAGLPHADVILYYGDLRKDNSLFKPALELFFGELNEDIFQKALEMSSFESIRKIAAFHARDGRVGQYKEVMEKDMIDYIKNKWSEINGK